MVRRPLALAGALAGACTADAGTPGSAPCAELVSFRDRPDLYRIEPLPDGYVLEDRGDLVGFGLDDDERFRIGAAAHELALVGDELVTVANPDGVVVVEAWAPDGSSRGELGRLEDSAPLELTGAAILDDRSVLAYGGDFQDFWTARVTPGAAAAVARSSETQRRDAVAAGGSDAYVVHSSWHDPMGVFEQLRLSRLGPGDSVSWSVTVFDRRDDSVPLERSDSLASAGGDAYLTTLVQDATSGPTYHIRRYGPDGDLLWTRTEPQVGFAPPGLPSTRPDGTLVWIDKADGDIRVRFLDDDGDPLCEETIPNDGQPITDVASIGDELFVVTVDRLTRIRLADPPEP